MAYFVLAGSPRFRSKSATIFCFVRELQRITPDAGCSPDMTRNGPIFEGGRLQPKYNPETHYLAIPGNVNLVNTVLAASYEKVRNCATYSMAYACVPGIWVRNWALAGM